LDEVIQISIYPDRSDGPPICRQKESHFGYVTTVNPDDLVLIEN